MFDETPGTKPGFFLNIFDKLTNNDLNSPSLSVHLQNIIYNLNYDATT